MNCVPFFQKVAPENYDKSVEGALKFGHLKSYLKIHIDFVRVKRVIISYTIRGTSCGNKGNHTVFVLREIHLLHNTRQIYTKHKLHIKNTHFINKLQYKTGQILRQSRISRKSSFSCHCLEKVYIPTRTKST